MGFVPLHVSHCLILVPVAGSIRSDIWAILVVVDQIESFRPDRCMNVRISRYLGLVIIASMHVVGYIGTMMIAASLLRTKAILQILSRTDADA